MCFSESNVTIKIINKRIDCVIPFFFRLVIIAKRTIKEIQLNFINFLLGLIFEDRSFSPTIMRVQTDQLKQVTFEHSKTSAIQP